jgi:hypothetical protein
MSGVVSALSGSCPNLSFKVGADTVVTDHDTKYKGGNCRSLRNGGDVSVKGKRQSNGSILADEIKTDR